jgi:hypothetical protein
METRTTPSNRASDERDRPHELQDYQGGDIQDRHGYIPVWLLVVYAVGFLWGLYYAYIYWGGVGLGRIQ